MAWKKARRNPRDGSHARMIEAMEPRLLLSAVSPSHFMPTSHHVVTVKPVKGSKKSKAAVAKPGAIVVGPAKSSPTVSPDSSPTAGPPTFTPAQLKHFYGIDTVTFGQITGNGAGETIAVIDAYNQPHLLPSGNPNFDTSSNDLYEFDQQFGLPDPPSFKVVDEYGSTTNRPSTYNSGWAYEISLDVEWSHAIAPMANIILVECYSATNSDLMSQAVITAENLGANVISMSFTTTEANYNFSATGVTFVASAGDTGTKSTDFPAASPNVVAVGGTSITTADSNGTYSSETTWDDRYGSTGGGISVSQTKPVYQSSYPSSIIQNAAYRTIPDVALDADPATGVWILDTSQSGGGGWYGIGGTSLSAPCWAGLVAIADQGRASIGLSSLSGSASGGTTGTLPRLYQLPSSDYHDITTGGNGTYNAGSGYDLVTGLGTPIANKLLPDLAGGATLTGQVFQDNNADGVYDGNDVALGGKVVYLDLYNLGYQVASDPTATTNSSGDFTFTDLPGTAGTVRLASVPTGYVQVGNSAFTTSFDATSTVALAYFPTAFSDPNSNDTYTLRLSSTLPMQVQILINNSLTYFAPVSLAPSFSFTFTGSGDSMVINAANGNPIPSGGVAVHGSALSLLGTSGNDTITVNSGSITFDSEPITFSNISSITVNPGVGDNTLAVNAGTVTIPPQTPSQGILLRQFANLSVASDASLHISTSTAHADHTVILASNLSVSSTGTLDLGGNDMIARNGSLSNLTSLLTTGFNNGSWNGVGIDSAAAHNDPTYLTALGVIVNNTGGSNTIYSTFDNQQVFASDVLIKYTYYGDTNLDGQVDGTDYSEIDAAYGNSALTGWVNGDFNYSSTIDGSDYTLIDNAYNMQGAPM